MRVRLIDWVELISAALVLYTAGLRSGLKTAESEYHRGLSDGRRIQIQELQNCEQGIGIPVCPDGEFIQQ
jgi:hypothetical protein